MKKNNILVISDNEYLIKNFKKILDMKSKENYEVDFSISYNNTVLLKKITSEKEKIISLNVKKESEKLIDKYDLIISLHCKQLFPKELVEKVRCVNIHPGYNPFNRGWFPQVFSILNRLPIGVTIHEMDDQLDHGPIIVQEKMDINSWDTSLSIYNKVIQLELNLINTWFEQIVNNNYITFKPEIEGNVNLKSDYNDLCQLDLTKEQSIKETLQILAALTHGEYNNAFFVDDCGEKVFVKLSLEKKV